MFSFLSRDTTPGATSFPGHLMEASLWQERMRTVTERTEPRQVLRNYLSPGSSGFRSETQPCPFQLWKPVAFICLCYWVVLCLLKMNSPEWPHMISVGMMDTRIKLGMSGTQILGSFKHFPVLPPASVSWLLQTGSQKMRLITVLIHVVWGEDFKRYH